MHLEIDQVEDPAGILDAWRDACWDGDSRTEFEALERWRSLSPAWAAAAERVAVGAAMNAPIDVEPADGPADGPESRPDAESGTTVGTGTDPGWLAAVELERAAAFPSVSTGRGELALERMVSFARASTDPVEVALAEQSVVTDRLRACETTPDLLDQVLQTARAALGTPAQQARACLNAAWAYRADRDQAVAWAREGLNRLGPVTVHDERATRELALHLLQQASEFLSWPEQSVMAQSMLALLRDGENPTWRARILRRQWSSALQGGPEVAAPLLLQAVDAAVESRRGRSMWEIASALVTCVQFRELTPQDVLGHLRRLSGAADHSQDLLAAVHIKSYLVEVLAQGNDDAGALDVGQAALGTLSHLRTADRVTGGRLVLASEWATLWASLAATLATAAANLERPDTAATLAAESLDVHRELGYNLMAATTALELADYCKDAGWLDKALIALATARELAAAEGDSDLQARAFARIPQVIQLSDGALAALAACDEAETAINGLLIDLEDPVDRGLVAWEAMDLRRLRAEILADAGGLRQAVDALDGVAETFLEYGYSPQAAEVLVVTGHYLAALGDETAVAAWARAVEVADLHGDTWIRHEAVTVWVDWLASHGRTREADDLRERWRSTGT